MCEYTIVSHLSIIENDILVRTAWELCPIKLEYANDPVNNWFSTRQNLSLGFQIKWDSQQCAQLENVASLDMILSTRICTMYDEWSQAPTRCWIGLCPHSLPVDSPNMDRRHADIGILANIRGTSFSKWSLWPLRMGSLFDLRQTHWYHFAIHFIRFCMSICETLNWSRKSSNYIRGRVSHIFDLMWYMEGFERSSLCEIHTRCYTHLCGRLLERKTRKIYFMTNSYWWNVSSILMQYNLCDSCKGFGTLYYCHLRAVYRLIVQCLAMWHACTSLVYTACKSIPVWDFSQHNIDIC